jgi:hypothetical protein
MDNNIDIENQLKLGEKQIEVEKNTFINNLLYNGVGEEMKTILETPIKISKFKIFLYKIKKFFKIFS